MAVFAETGTVEAGDGYFKKPREERPMMLRGISDRAMRELAGVNSAFVSMAVLESPEKGGCLGLKKETLARLRLLEDEALRRLARRPHALFTLRFHDVTGWTALLERRVRDGERLYSWPDEASRLHQFLVMTLVTVRELAEREPPAASVLFGIPPDLVGTLNRFDIGALPGVAAAVRPWLKACLGARPEWWSLNIIMSCARTLEPANFHRGVHGSLMRALNLNRARLREGRLCRRRRQ